MAGGEFLAGAIVAKLVLDKSGWDASIKKIQSDGQKMAGMSASTATAFRQMGSVAMVAGGAILGALGSCVNEAMKFGKVTAQLDAVLRSTAGAAGVTREQALGLAEEMQKLTRYSHEEVIGGENLLLTFTAIGKDIFPQATQTMLDMSTALGQDLKNSAIQLGKALQDPAQGVTALRRVGVNFTKDQQKLIKVLVDTGNSAKAQQIILRELATEFGGSAKAAAQGFGGQMAQLKNELSDVQREIGTALLPILKSMATAIKEQVVKVKEWIEAHPKLADALIKGAAAVGVLLGVLGPLLFMLPNIVAGFGILKTAALGLSGPFAIVVTAALAVGAALNSLINKYKATQDAEMAAIVKTSQPMATALKLRDTAIKANIITHEQWRKLFNDSGRDYSKMLATIASDPAYAKLNAELQKLQKEQQGVAGEADKTGKSLSEQGVAAGESTDDIYGLAKELQGAAKAEKDYNDWVKTTIPNMTELSSWLGRVESDYSKGKLTGDQYRLAVTELGDKFDKLGVNINKVLPPARDMSAVWDDIKPKIGELPRILEDTAYGFRDQSAMLRNWSSELNVSTNVVASMIYEMQRLQFQLSMIALNFAGGGIGGIGALPSMMGRMGVQWTADAKTTSQSMSDIFAGGFNDIAQKFGDTLSSFIEEGFNFKKLWSDLWSGIKDVFFNILGEMATKFIKDFLGSLISNAGEAAGKAASNIASTASSAVSGISSILSGGLAPAIGSFVGTFLGSIIGGGPSGHQQQQQINDTKDSRNFLADIKNWLFSAGSGFGGAIWDFAQKFTNEKIDELKGFVARLGDEQLGPKIDQSNNYLYAIERWAAAISKGIDAIASSAGAQEGAIIKRPSFLKVHANEAIVPFSKMPQLAAQVQGAQRIEINNAVNLNGQIISDRDYMRTRLLDELISALDSGTARNRLQRALGVG